jgi:hypothetical protein
MKITWKHDHTAFAWPWTIDNKIEIYYGRTFGWQLHIADLMANGGKDGDGHDTVRIPHSGFAVLHVCLSYFESHAKYEDGFASHGKSAFYFKKGVKTVFQQLNQWPTTAVDPFLDTLYEAARCGLYHGSMTLAGIVLTGSIGSTVAFNQKHNRIALNPHRLPVDLKGHLGDYVTKLRDMSQTVLRQNFEKRFNFDNGITGAAGQALPVSAAAEESGSIG